MDPLDTSQKDKVKQFQEITNIEDPDIAACTLASLDWNLERAIETHLLNDMDDEEQNRPEVEVIPLPERPQRPNSPVVPKAHNPPEVVDMDLCFDDDDEPVAHTRVSNILRAGRRMQPSSSSSYIPAGTESDEDFDFDEEDDTHHADAVPRPPKKRGNSDIPLIPQDSESVLESLNNFVTIFESRYCGNGGAFMPCFSVDTLNNTIREAFDAPGRPISERKPLALYIHNDKSVAANIFATNVMCKDEVSHLLRHQFVLWGWDVTFRENQVKLLEWLQAQSILEARSIFETMHYDRDRFPLLVLLTKEKGTLKIVNICDGTEGPQQVITKLLSCVEEYTTIRMNEMQEQREREEREMIRQEQAQEYEKSLAADRARREAKEREIKEQKEEEDRRIRAEEEEKMRRAQLESELPDEPDEKAPDAIVVKFRFPNGEQVMRRFRTSDRLNVLLNFLSSKGFSKEQYRFFNCDVPKQDISLWDANSTFVVLKWPRRDQIFVEEQ